VTLRTTELLSSRAERSDSLANRIAKSRDLVFRLLVTQAICIGLLSIGSATMLAQQAPPGWRSPTRTEAPGKWREKSQTRFLRVDGDFDGDGKTDTAELFVNPSSRQFGLFVKLASGGTWQLVNEAADVKALARIGISLVKPGKYETACGKGYDDSFCAHGEPDFLTLSTAAVDLFVEESADSIVYWDRGAKEFRKIQMSD
jgi:hypothetical protein